MTFKEMCAWQNAALVVASLCLLGCGRKDSTAQMPLEIPDAVEYHAPDGRIEKNGAEFQIESRKNDSTPIAGSSKPRSEMRLPDIPGAENGMPLKFQYTVTFDEDWKFDDERITVFQLQQKVAQGGKFTSPPFELQIVGDQIKAIKRHSPKPAGQHDVRTDKAHGRDIAVFTLSKSDLGKPITFDIQIKLDPIKNAQGQIIISASIDGENLENTVKNKSQITIQDGVTTYKGQVGYYGEVNPKIGLYRFDTKKAVQDSKELTINGYELEVDSQSSAQNMLWATVLGNTAGRSI